MKISRFLERIKAFPQDVHEFSVGVAWGRFQRGFPFVTWKHRRTVYENSILNYFESEYGQLLDSFEVRNEKSVAGKKYVWTMWWQGTDKMPPIVRACYDRMLKLFSDDLILITEDNYTEWVELPDYIVKKHNDGLISTTHLSDIIRVELLRRYGGAWVDATIYLDHMPEEIYTYDFFTLHAPGMFPEFISRGSWSTFFLFIQSEESSLFVLLSELYKDYWLKHTEIIDYVMFDFLIELIASHKHVVQTQIDSLPENRGYYDLNLAINDAYSAEKRQSILVRSPIQKLTYKKIFAMQTADGMTTNYGRIIERLF